MTQAGHGAVRALLDNGLHHFQHGPIDLIIGVDGEPACVRAGLEAAWQRFGNILPELVTELPQLRRPVGEWARHSTPATCVAGAALASPVSSRQAQAGDMPDIPFQTPVAQRMGRACWPYRHGFVTAMAAVAGSVADEILQTILAVAPNLRRVFVNNGGDIALYLAPEETYNVGLVSNIDQVRVMASAASPALGNAAGVHALAQSQKAAAQGMAEPIIAPDGTLTVHAAQGIGGIATSGWRGRSFSLGIADSVTVLAATAAQADVAATLIANQVNADHPAIVRAPANTLKDDTDLGDRRVTVDVGPLPEIIIRQALTHGAQLARQWQADGLILGAVLMLQGHVEAVLPATAPHRHVA
ncbi:UPF0280 family protein [Pusillimonas minor]|uniref:UPF0280 family protein n=1 Tax=Pusillimonas minor TaxID=2697024 RepID=A0A842HND6_9BURK|nr:UPF0280 family protein [Pusillimonas minor]MBC2769232.1 UPF0280 family protein [Pusillimonas minor]